MFYTNTCSHVKGGHFPVVEKVETTVARISR